MDRNGVQRNDPPTRLQRRQSYLDRVSEYFKKSGVPEGVYYDAIGGVSFNGLSRSAPSTGNDFLDAARVPVNRKSVPGSQQKEQIKSSDTILKLVY